MPDAIDANARAGSPLPRGPRLPQSLQAVLRIWRYAEFSDRGHARYGDTFTVRVGGLPAAVLTKDREAIRRLFTGDPLSKRHANDLLAPSVGEQSMLLLEPAEHLARRRMLLPPFHGEQVQSHARLLERLAGAELDRLQPGDVAAVQPIVPDQDGVGLTDEQLPDERHPQRSCRAGWASGLPVRVRASVSRLRAGA
jgi:cytochrome P450